MNSISRNKYIDKSATPLKAYFTLASAREREQTTYAPACVRTRILHIYKYTCIEADRHLAAREKEDEERAEGREGSGYTYRRVVCSVYKESCLFLADGYRRKTICLGDLECFVSPPPPPPNPAALSSSCPVSFLSYAIFAESNTRRE